MRTIHDHASSGYPQASHTTDPASSHAAEAQHTRSGKRRANIMRVLAALRVHPRSTAAELAAHLDDMDAVEVRRRLYDLRSMNPPLARACALRACTVARRQVQTWEAAPHA